jgi:hypothetical protein
MTRTTPRRVAHNLAQADALPQRDGMLLFAGAALVTLIVVDLMELSSRRHRA